MITDTMRALLGQRVQLIDVPLRLQNTPPVPPGTFMEAWGVDGELTAVERAAIRRDLHCCRACGFVSEEHQRAVALNGNRRDLDQTVTLCLFCHQCFHLDKVAGMESGVLIRLPELTQAELHHVARELYVGRVLGGETAATAQACLDALLARRAQARERIGSDDPAALAERLAAADDPAALDAELDGIRLLPLDRRLVRKGNVLENLFPPIVGYWVSCSGCSPAADVERSRWVKLLLTAIDIDGFKKWEPNAAAVMPSHDFGLPNICGPDGNRRPNFNYRLKPGDFFTYEITRLNPQNMEYERVGYYRIIDVTQTREIIEMKVNAIIQLMNGDAHKVQSFGSKTGTRLLTTEFRKDPKTKQVDFATYDGRVVVADSRLEILDEVFGSKW
jgi:intracellular multiplication protein IcmJ